MNGLNEKTASIFKKDMLEELDENEMYVFLNMFEDYQDKTFRDLCWKAADCKCVITQEELDLNKNEHNTNPQHHTFGRYLSIEHMASQSLNRNSNFIGNFIPIKGNLNSSIGTKGTEEYLIHTLKYTIGQMDQYRKRIDEFRDKLFILMKKYYSDDVFVKFEKRYVENKIKEYELSSYTNIIGTLDELARILDLDLANPKREVYKLAKAFDIQINKLTKAQALFAIEYQEIKKMLETDHSYKDIASMFGVKLKDIKHLIQEDDVLSQIENAETVSENRVINICETNSEEIMADFYSGKSVKWICDNYHMQRDHGIVKMFIHMKSQVIDADTLKQAAEKELNELKNLSKLNGVIPKVNFDVISFSQNNKSKTLKIKLQLKD